MLQKFRIIGIVCLSLLALVVVGCSEDKESPGVKKDRQFQERVSDQRNAAVGYPKVKSFAESANLKRRYEQVDDPEQVGYIYLMNYGRIFAEHVVKGKVSSLNSNLTNPRVLHCTKVQIPNYDDQAACGDIDQAEPDGSFGDNPEGIFFWTTDGTYVEWSGDYQYSSERLELTEPPLAVLNKNVP